MSDSIIKVEGLGKKYIITHEQQAGRYTALRDVISRKAKDLVKGKKNELPPKEDFWALKDVSFEVKKGEAIGIIGRNGAGKSTLLKILSRITEPSKGRIELNGRVASLLEVGTGFHPELTGRENIFLNGAILGMSQSEIRSKFDEIVDFSGVEKFLDTPVKRYSSGMYVRLAFAVAAHLEPEILVIDEVLAVGDAEFQRKCMGKMKEVSEGSGRTVLFVSHNMTAVKQLCSKSLLLVNGSTDFYGSTNEALERYQHKEDNVVAFRGIKSNQIAGIKTWYLSDIKNKPNFSSYTREIANINIEVESNEILYKTELGFILRDQNGAIIYSCNTRDFGADFFTIEKGSYLFNLKIRLPLKAGEYIVDIAIASEGKIIDQWVSPKELVVLDDYTGVLEEKWQGILNEKFSFTYEKSN